MCHFGHESIGSGESPNLSTYFPVGTKYEVISAPTLGSTLGINLYSSSNNNNEIPQNWTAGVPDSSDLLYLWDAQSSYWEAYFFLDASYEGSGWGRGWYPQANPSGGLQNHKILYDGGGSVLGHPDHDIMFFKRTPGDLSFDSEITLKNPNRLVIKCLISTTGGPDQGHFQICENGLLTFVDPPNFESPSDANSDGIYEVTVRVEGSSLFDEQTIMVIVTNDSTDDPVALTDANFQSAINLWFSDEANATATYGHIRDWNTSAVTNMSGAFLGKTTFNEDITGWDTICNEHVRYVYGCICFQSEHR